MKLDGVQVALCLHTISYRIGSKMYLSTRLSFGRKSVKVHVINYVIRPNRFFIFNNTFSFSCSSQFTMVEHSSEPEDTKLIYKFDFAG